LLQKSRWGDKEKVGGGDGRQRQTVVNGGTHATSCDWRRRDLSNSAHEVSVW